MAPLAWQGTFGMVHKAKCLSDGQVYCLKRIAVAPGQDGSSSALAEAQLLSSLDHPNIIHYKESFIDPADGALCIVTTFCAGGDLASEIRRRASGGAAGASGGGGGGGGGSGGGGRRAGRAGRLRAAYFSEDEVMDLFLQVAGALHYIHSRRVLHRDLKAQNVLLAGGGVVMLADFGISKVLEQAESFATTVVGTPLVMAPEICTSKPYTFKSDIWSLGCVLYETATLEHAFSADCFLSLVYKIVKGEVPTLPQGRYSGGLGALIARLLTREPVLRPSLQEVFAMPYVQRHVQRFNAQQRRRVLEQRLSLRSLARSSASADSPAAAGAGGEAEGPAGAAAAAAAAAEQQEAPQWRRRRPEAKQARCSSARQVRDEAAAGALQKQRQEAECAYLRESTAVQLHGPGPLQRALAGIGAAAARSAAPPSPPPPHGPAPLRVPPSPPSPAAAPSPGSAGGFKFGLSTEERSSTLSSSPGPGGRGASAPPLFGAGGALACGAAAAAAAWPPAPTQRAADDDALTAFGLDCDARLVFGLRTDSRPECVFEIAARGGCGAPESASCVITVSPRDPLGLCKQAKAEGGSAAAAQQPGEEQELGAAAGGWGAAAPPQLSHAQSAGSFLRFIHRSYSSAGLFARRYPSGLTSDSHTEADEAPASDDNLEICVTSDDADEDWGGPEAAGSGGARCAGARGSSSSGNGGSGSGSGGSGSGSGGGGEEGAEEAWGSERAMLMRERRDLQRRLRIIASVSDLSR
ncbi:MAG: kinase-like domain-containing protein [Monoraphidium minutum]|nr:MAG: kinase-like domain-containing protein [Monoraphidium minutum]